MKINLFLFLFALSASGAELFVSHAVQAQTIAAGGRHTLFVCSDSTVRSCGDNYYGQLDDGTFTDKNIPVQDLVSMRLYFFLLGICHFKHF